jgi:O-antigen/teichoic acid export membrane protein
MTDEPEHPALAQAMVRGLRWLALTRVVSETLALAAAVALARLVSPAAFGRAAVATIFVMLAGMLTFEGFASSLVQQAEVTEADRRAAMLLSIVGGAVMSLVLYALTVPVWRPLFGGPTSRLIAFVSPVLFIAALGSVSRATLLRRLDFRLVSLSDVVSLLLGSVVAVGLAAIGLQGRAIVLGAIAQTAIGSLTLMIASRPPAPSWSLQSLRQIGAFGLPAALAASVDTLLRNIDYAILAARLPAAQVGFYYRAFNVGVVYQDKISKVMAQIAFPLYSRTTSPEELRHLHERAARVHAVVIFPLLALLIALAPVAVPFVFGAAWEPAVAPTQIMAVAGMIAAVLTGYPQVMLAIRRPRPLLWMNVAMLVLYGVVITVASRHGLATVALAVVGAYAVNLLAIYHLLLQPYVGISVKRLISELGPALVGCLALLVVAVPLSRLIEGAIPRAATIVIVASAGLTAYALVLGFVFPAAWSDLRGLAVRVLPGLGRIRRRPARTAPASAAS